jgi:hypothetical protein
MVWYALLIGVVGTQLVTLVAFGWLAVRAIIEDRRGRRDLEALYRLPARRPIREPKW